jgi:hypothetical protein
MSPVAGISGTGSASRDDGHALTPLERLSQGLERSLRHVPYPVGVQAVRLAAPAVLAMARAPDREILFAVPSACSAGSLVRRRLLTNLLGRPRLVALARSRWPEDGQRWFAAEGLGHLEAAAAGGRKVIVASSHYGAPQCVALMLARLGHRLHSVECCDPFGPLGIQRPPTLAVIPTSNNFLGKVAVAARRALLDEGLIVIAADGYVGASGLTLPFHGRARRFNAGFAELAVATDARVVPAMASLDDHGRATLRLFAPLEDAPGDATRPARVDVLIRRYADWLERQWADDSGNVLNMAIFAALPAWTPWRAGTEDGAECSSTGTPGREA